MASPEKRNGGKMYEEENSVGRETERESKRQSTCLHSISNRFLRFIGRFREKTYGRRRRRLSLLWFRGWPPIFPSLGVDLYVCARGERGMARLPGGPTRFYVARNDRLFGSAGNSLTAVFHPRRSSFFSGKSFSKVGDFLAARVYRVHVHACVYYRVMWISG